MTSIRNEQNCIFCDGAALEPTVDLLTLYRNDHAIVMLNRYPYANAHLMIAPRSHVARLDESGAPALLSLIRLAAESQRILAETYNPDGFNVGMNFGKAGGAGFADHYHLHVVPRWSGDTNFMSVTAATRIVPESLEVTWEKLRMPFATLRRDVAGMDDAT